MTKRKAVKKRPGRVAQWERPSTDALAKDTLGWWAGQYVGWLRERNYSPRTVGLRESYLNNFVAWCEARSLHYPQEITRAIVERYQSTLFHHRKDDGRSLSFQSQCARLISVRMYFKWLARQHIIALSPASELELPKVVKQLPRTVLTALEAEAVIKLPDVNDVLGLRDRAILEVLYSTAIRRAELVHLRVFDVDRHRGTLMVREGKGKRDRVAPLGERALLWVEKYLGESRPELVAAIDDGTLFLTNTGEPISLMWASQVVRRYVEHANLGKLGACHLFRHTAATLMLENGADIRFIQQLLGHAKLDTTAIYTHVSIHKLKEVHALTHPGARLGRAQSADGNGASAQIDLLAFPLAAQSDRIAEAAELHDLLAQEAEQEAET
jgi:integrase/recombinase XerD